MRFGDAVHISNLSMVDFHKDLMDGMAAQALKHDLALEKIAGGLDKMGVAVEKMAVAVEKMAAALEVKKEEEVDSEASSEGEDEGETRENVDATMTEE